MNQPKVFFENKIYEVASVWWSDGEIDHIVIHKDESVDALFSGEYDLQSLFVKEDEVNA